MPFRISHHEAEGDAIVARLATAKLTGDLKAAVTTFRARHAALKSTSATALTAREARDAALAKVASNDMALDRAVLALADALVASALGARRNPFAGYAHYAPSKLCDLAYADEIKEVRKLVAKASKAKGAPTTALKLVSKCADAVEAALRGLATPQAKAAQALAVRDASLPDWQNALTRLKIKAGAAWIDEPGKYGAIFAAPEAVVERVKPSKATKAKRAAKSKATRAAKGGKGAEGATA